MIIHNGSHGSVYTCVIPFYTNVTEFDIEATVKACKKAKLRGVMMDTAGKSAGSLLLHRKISELTSFIQTAKRLNLLTGLAGSLREKDIQTLLPINPDYIGFRTALCKDLIRTAPVSSTAVENIRKQIPVTTARISHA